MTHKLLPCLLLGCILLSCTISDRDFQIKGVQCNPTLAFSFSSNDTSIASLPGDPDDYVPAFAKKPDIGIGLQKNSIAIALPLYSRMNS